MKNSRLNLKIKISPKLVHPSELIGTYFKCAGGICTILDYSQGRFYRSDIRLNRSNISRRYSFGYSLDEIAKNVKMHYWDFEDKNISAKLDGIRNWMIRNGISCSNK